MRRRIAGGAGAVCACVLVLLTSCGTTKNGNNAATTAGRSPLTAQGSAAATAIAGEQPLPQEKSPVGDIPDSQAFISFNSPTGGYTLDAPEGWARTEQGGGVTFADKFDGEQVLLTSLTGATTPGPTMEQAVASIQQGGRAVHVDKSQPVQLPGGPALMVAYTSNSEPDPVTGKQVRLENNAYIFSTGGRVATLRLWAPLGADNVDQWNRISRSFRWN